jgi:hypothetical protein
MPIYLYKNPETEDVIEVLQGINEAHEFSQNGIKFERVFCIPNVAVDSRIDPYNSKSFVEKTRNKKGTIGDLLKESQELSERRGGEKSDPIKNQFYKNYEKENGVRHSSQIANEKTQKAKEKLKKIGISIEN